MLIQTEKNRLLSEVFVSNLQTTPGSKRLIADRITHRFFKFSTLIGNFEKKKLNKSQTQPWTRFTQELVIRIAYTKVSLLSFMRNMSIYSLHFKRETHTNSLQRYCTKVYTVKAERAIQITHTHKHTTVRTHRHSTSMQPADVVYQQIIHTYSRKRAEKHLKYTTEGILN